MVDKNRFITELHNNLIKNILPYWTKNMVDPTGGFYGRRDGYDRLDKRACKGAILNARILWTFSAAYKYDKNPEYLKIATKAKNYITDSFFDKANGGIFWSLNPDNTPLDTRKQFYAMAFCIYGLSEYYSVTLNEDSLKSALELFRLIELHSRDNKKGGYIEATTAEWQPIKDMRLSDKDLNVSKTMNTHLHILEGYTTLLKVSHTAKIEEAVRNLIDIFLTRIMRTDGHLGLFFDEDWNPQDRIESYGHDIEASWLILEAALTLGDNALISRVKEYTKKMAIAGLEGLKQDSSMDYEKLDNGNIDDEKHWWVQAESVVGQIYMYIYHNHEPSLQSAWNSWKYISRNIVDHKNGEWFWSRKNGEINRKDDKAGFWKCPYHNSRMCIETITRLRHATE